MDCEKLRSQLDAYLDGELSEAEARALEDHAKACEGCARELEAARLVRDALADMDAEVAVPLEAQAAWRAAVRAEARRRSVRKWRRLSCVAAAALVLVFGGSLMLRGAPDAPDAAQPQPVMLLSGNEVSGRGIIARDGDAEPAADVGEEAYAAWKKIETEDASAAMETLRALAEEYSGTCFEEGEEACRVELPCAYLEDFLNAISRIGTELDSESGDLNVETAVVYIQLQEI